MAAPLSKEDRTRIKDYLKQQDLPELTGFKIKELVRENLGIDMSQPTASKLKGEILEDDSFDEMGAMAEPIELNNIRHLSQAQQNVIGSLLRGQSDRVAAEAAGVSLQTVWDWRNNDPLFISELNRQRVGLWSEARERMKSLANRALDVLEQQLNSDDPKAALAAARYVLQGTKLLGDTDLSIRGPTTPEEVILEKLRREARQELIASDGNHMPGYSVLGSDPLNTVAEMNLAGLVDDLAKSRLKKALADAGLA